MKILICCAAGMSSSLLVQKMRTEVQNRHLEDMKVGACSLNQLKQYAKEADVLLMAPHINYISEEIEELNLPHLKIIHITHQEYGHLDVQSLIDRILIEDTSKPQTNKLNPKYKSFYDFLTPFALKISTNRFLESISKSFTSIMPITMIGSIFTLLENIPFPFYLKFINETGLVELFNLMNGATIDILSLYLVFYITYHYVRSHDEHGHPAGLIATICFFLITGRQGNTYSPEYLGTKGIFGAIFIGITTGMLYIKVQRSNTLKLPRTIPKQVYRSLMSIYPAFMIITFFTAITYLISLTPYGNLHNLFYQALQTTLVNYLGNNIVSFVFFQFVCNILWFFGIHGGNIITSITNPIYIPLAIENFNLYSQGLEPINIISNSFAKCFTSGGVGSMFSLSILMTYFSKSEQYKTLGRISLPTTFFYINEPLLFGIPVIMNPLYFFPLMIATPLLGTITYFVMKIGLVPIPRGLQLPWTTPPILYGFLQGGYKLALWEIVSIVLAMLIWYPFFKRGDEDAYKKEHNECHN